MIVEHFVGYVQEEPERLPIVEQAMREFVSNLQLKLKSEQTLAASPFAGLPTFDDELFQDFPCGPRHPDLARAVSRCEAGRGAALLIRTSEDLKGAIGLDLLTALQRVAVVPIAQVRQAWLDKTDEEAMTVLVNCAMAERVRMRAVLAQRSVYRKIPYAGR